MPGPPLRPASEETFTMEPPPPLPEMRHAVLGTQEARTRVDAHEQVPFGFLKLGDGAGALSAGVVHYHVNAAHLLRRPLHQRLHVFSFGHVSLHEPGATALILDVRDRPLGVV